MGTIKKLPDDSKLRRLAEADLAAPSDEHDDLSGLSPKDMAGLIHELRVHQIELKMQNEELRRIQDELETARNRYSHLYDFAPVGYFTVNDNGIVAEANLTATTLLGMDRAVLIGSPFSRFILHADQDIFYLHRKQLLETKKPQTCRLRLVRKDGSQFYANLECIVVEEGDDCPKQIRIVVSDITELMNLEDQLRQSQKLEAIGSLTGGIAHEFNNILNIIIGNNELMMDELPEGSPAREYAEEILLASLRASDVVKQLVLFSRQDDAKKKPVDIGSVVKSSMKLIRSAIPKHIDIKQNIPDDVAPIFGNAIQINQLLINLCGNAVDAMPNKGGIVTIDLSSETLDEKGASVHPPLSPGRYIKLRVSDNGSGMDRQTLARIFDPYFTTKAIGKGTGIGLAVVHGIVAGHNGALSVESGPDKGTVFSILFPAIPESPAF